MYIHTLDLYLKNDQVIYYTSTGKFYENHDERTSKKEKTRKKKSFNRLYVDLNINDKR